MISLSVSSETPADRGGSSAANESAATSTQAGSATPEPAVSGSPETPVRPRHPADDGSDGADRPGADRPGADRPGADRPGADRPGADRPGADRPGDGRQTAIEADRRPDPLAAAEEAVDNDRARGRSDQRSGDDDEESDRTDGSGGRGGPTGNGTDTEQAPGAGKHRGVDSKGQGRQGRGKHDQGKHDQGKQGQGKQGQGGNAGGLPTTKRFKVLQGLGPTEPRPEVPDQSHLPAGQRTDLAVRVQHLYVTYRTSFEKKPTLRQAVMRLGRGQRAVREVQALKDISFEVKTGTAMGIIGRNGAGKSTLMRAMAGILPPTQGTVEVWGRASTLLALGVGFNNSLSGRENIILGGLAAGLSRAEVEARADEIAEWTELGDFIDMPMRTYSSGMFSRVAFSVAVHMEPDILMIDEALSTGDAHFREKAGAKMAELRSRARAMFLVSHGLGSIKELCDEAIWIDKGRLMQRGEPEEVVEAYLKHMNTRRSATALEDL